jgi:hypothetical protein
VKIVRVYADEAGTSHFGDLDVELVDRGPIGRLSSPLPTTDVVFRENDPDYDYDWHVAPRRQLVVLLDGEIEIEVGDGERRSFRGGDVLLVEDTSGAGHRTRNVTRAPRRSLFVALAGEPGRG